MVRTMTRCRLPQGRHCKITKAILFKGENIGYSEATEGLYKIIKSGVFNREDKQAEQHKQGNDKSAIAPKKKQVGYNDDD